MTSPVPQPMTARARLAGQPLTYSLSVANAGPSSAPGVTS